MGEYDGVTIEIERAEMVLKADTVAEAIRERLQRRLEQDIVSALNDNTASVATEPAPITLEALGHMLTAMKALEAETPEVKYAWMCSKDYEELALASVRDLSRPFPSLLDASVNICADLERGEIYEVNYDMHRALINMQGQPERQAAFLRRMAAAFCAQARP